MDDKILYDVIDKGLWVNCAAPCEMDERIRDVYDKRRQEYGNTLLKRTDMCVGKYYAVCNDDAIGLYRIDGVDSERGYYNGEGIGLRRHLLACFYSSYISVTGKDTVVEITHDLFESVKKEICLMDETIKKIKQSVCRIEIVKDIYKDFHTYEIDSDVALFHRDVLDMTVREFHDMVDRHNRDVFSRIEDLKRHCDERLSGKYVIQYGVFKETVIVKVKDFKIRKTVGGRYGEITTHDLAFDNERLVANDNGYYSLARYKNTLAGFFDSGQSVKVLPNDVGDALFNQYDSVTSELRSLLSNILVADDKKGGISYDK